MEPEYPFDEGMNDFEGREPPDSAQHYRRATGIGDTVAEQRVYARDVRRAAPRRRPPPPRSEEGMLEITVSPVFTTWPKSVLRFVNSSPEGALR